LHEFVQHSHIIHPVDNPITSRHIIVNPIN
jgi:hypothetical protein